MLKKVIDFVKSPVYQEDSTLDLSYRFTVFVRLLAWSLVISLGLGLLIGVLEAVIGLDFGQHAMDLLMEQYSPGFVVLMAIVAAPILEELLFRGPLRFFKSSRYFPFFFYFFTLAFGFYHITNFEINSTVLLCSPLLVAPQLSVGAFLGYIRVRFGLLWAILLHAAYNFFLVGPIVVLRIFDLSTA